LRWLGSASSGSLKGLLRADITSLASLGHPALALPAAFGTDLETGRGYLLRPYIEGSDIVIALQGKTPKEALPWLLQSAEALAILHRLGLLHRNLKASNFIVPRAAIFGRRYQGPRVVLSDPAWWPENDPPSTVPSELYDLGLVYYRLLTGRLAQVSESGFPPSPSELNPRVPVDLERLVLKLLHPDPSKRYRDTDSLIGDLRLLSAKQPAQLSAPECFLGREAELSHAVTCLCEPVEPGAIAVTGGAGMGKTSFLRRLAREAEVLGYRTVLSRCYPESAVPFQPLRSIADALIPRGALGRSLRLRYRRLLEETRSASEAGAEGSSRRRVFLKGLRSIFFDAAAAGPVLILVDDAHLADSMTLELLAGLVREPAPSRLSLAVSLRAESPFRDFVKPLLDAFGSRGERRVLKLAPLPSLATAARSQAELLTTSYFDSLDKTQRLLLEALAVLGRPASRDLLEALLGEPSQRLRASLEMLLLQGTLSREGALYFFPHGSSHLWLLEKTAGKKRQALHRRIALALDGRKQGSVQEIAHHWLESDQPRNGLAAALAAARALAQSHEDRVALRFYGAVLGFVSAADRRRRALAEEAADVCLRAGEYRRGAEVVDEILSGTRDRREAGRLHGRKGVLCHRAGDVSSATDHLEKGLALLAGARSAKWLRERLRIEAELAEISINRGDYAKAEAICRQALEGLGLERGARADFEICRAEMVLLGTMAHLKLRSFQYPESRDLFEQSLKVGEKLGSAPERGLILNNFGSLHAQENRFHAAIECFERAERISARFEDDHSRAVLHSNLAVLHARTGNPRAADDALRRAAEHNARCDSKRVHFLRLHSKGMVDSALGRYERGIETLEAAIGLGEELKDSYMAAFDLVHLGECRLFQGEPRAARAAFDRALGLRSPADLPISSMVEARRATLAALRGDLRGYQAAHTACAESSLHGIEYVRAWNRVFLGWAHRLMSHPEEAEDELTKALAFFKLVKVPPGEIHATLELAAARAESGRVGEAEELLHALKMKYPCGEGPLSNPMLSARLLLYQTRILVERSALEEAKALLVEAESYLIGRRIRDLEELVEDLRRRLHVSGRSTVSVATAGAGSLDEAGSPAETASGRAAPPFHASAILGQSAAIRKVIELVQQMSPASLPVLITGETGTGKEMVARALHGEGPRRSGPFLSLNCAALPVDLLEAELFGHVQGAFTGAVRDHVGLLASARGGVLLFDEVGEMPLQLQAKLLRILDRGGVRPLGSADEIPTDVRLLFSTNRNVSALVQERKFRRDLFFRLGAFEIAVPPLRERVEDLPLLVEHFRREAIGDGSSVFFDEDALRTLAAYPWPGNVRELRNAVFRLALTRTGRITADDVKLCLEKGRPSGLFSPEVLRSRPIEELLGHLEKEHLIQLHVDHGGDLKEMARVLGITLRALYGRFKRLGLRPGELAEQ
jgi:two-component system NtrC family response regulator